MRKLVLAASCAAMLATSAGAQLPFLTKRGPGQPAQTVPLQGMDALRADFLTRAGADAVYFGNGQDQLGVPARATLVAQSAWLRQHPEIVVTIEGYGDPGDTRDHAIAVGARRAEEVRGYLVLLGVPAAQLTITSWGKERSGAPRAVTVLVR